MTDYQKYLDPRTLNKIAKLEIKARLIVEGFVSGLHKSPYHGYSVEFAEHREYVPGDEIKHIDWKVYGRTDRYYIKEFEEETNLRCTILLDKSESMGYASESVSKFEYGSYIAASLAYLVLRQQDAVSLGVFSKELEAFVPSSSHPSHMRHIIHILEGARPANETKLGQVLHEVADRTDRRGLVIVISDLFDDVPSVLSGLKHLRHKRNEVILFHVLDRFELSFPFNRMTLFQGMEDYPDLLADPRALRKAYIAEIQAFIAEVRKGCIRDRIDYAQVTTDTLLDVALIQYLTTRSGARRSQGTRRG